MLKLRNELSNCLVEPVFEDISVCIFKDFSIVDIDFVKATILKFAPKTCLLDPIPTCLLLHHIDHIAEHITYIVNKSLLTGVFPNICKSAIIQPNIKKPNLELNELKKYRKSPICHFYKKN